MAFDKNELKWWAGLLSAVVMSIIGASAIPRPYDKVLMAFGAACGAISTYMMQPPKGS